MQNPKPYPRPTDQNLHFNKIPLPRESRAHENLKSTRLHTLWDPYSAEEREGKSLFLNFSSTWLYQLGPWAPSLDSIWIVIYLLDLRSSPKHILCRRGVHILIRQCASRNEGDGQSTQSTREVGHPVYRLESPQSWAALLHAPESSAFWFWALKGLWSLESLSSPWSHQHPFWKV